MDATVDAMVLRGRGGPLIPEAQGSVEPGPGQVRLRVRTCGICRTDLHVIDGDLPDPALPLVPGHQIVGVVDAVGAGVDDLEIGARVGVPWLGWTCGACSVLSQRS